MKTERPVRGIKQWQFACAGCSILKKKMQRSSESVGGADVNVNNGTLPEEPEGTG